MMLLLLYLAALLFLELAEMLRLSASHSARLIVDILFPTLLHAQYPYFYSTHPSTTRSIQALLWCVLCKAVIVV